MAILYFSNEKIRKKVSFDKIECHLVLVVTKKVKLCL
jgi:hypothetical protein